MNNPSVGVRILPHGEGIVSMPEYQTEGAAGFDVQCAEPKQFVLQGGERRVIPTGIALSIPAGYEGQCRPRSGLAAKNGITIVNSPGTIDSDYRGEIKVILLNTGSMPTIIKPGDRIAQIVIAPVARLPLIQTDDLGDTERGDRGFGSTGV